MCQQVVTAATRLRRELQDAPAPAREPFLALVAQVIRVNPDYYSMWNYRKEAAVLVLGDTVHDLSVTEADDSAKSSAGTDAQHTAALNAAVAYATPQSSSASSATASSSVSAADAAQTAAPAPVAEQQPSLTAAQIVQRELAITVEAFKRNPKSYSAWHHRRWVLSRGAAAVGGVEAYKRELELCAQVFVIQVFGLWHVYLAVVFFAITESNCCAT
jgi:Protein prenyltransferase alpha subunit repeat